MLKNFGHYNNLSTAANTFRCYAIEWESSYMRLKIVKTKEGRQTDS